MENKILTALRSLKNIMSAAQNIFLISTTQNTTTIVIKDPQKASLAAL